MLPVSESDVVCTECGTFLPEIIKHSLLWNVLLIFLVLLWPVYSYLTVHFVNISITVYLVLSMQGRWDHFKMISTVITQKILIMIAMSCLSSKYRIICHQDWTRTAVGFMLILTQGKIWMLLNCGLMLGSTVNLQDIILFVCICVIWHYHLWCRGGFH